MYLAPTIDEADEKKLRNGERITTPKTTDLYFRFRHKQADGKMGWRLGMVTVSAKDYDSAGVFFGDRPLDDPGYSAITLKGSVGVGQTNDVLDVYRVEQRLKYLGFPAMGATDTVSAPTLAHNVIQDFNVDGQWGRSESLAAYLFSDVITYSAGQRQLATPSGRSPGGKVLDTPANRTAYFNTLYAIADSFNISKNGTFDNTIYTSTPGAFTEWLNAYNAPHWMDIGHQMGSGVLSGWVNNQTSSTNRNVEVYGTSWMRDLMAATQFASEQLGTSKPFGFNGAVDANQGATPFMHGTHDLGMAFDLELKQFIKETTQNDGSQTNADITLPSSGWSVDHAAQWTETYLPHTLGPNNIAGNDQRDALRQFLQLYALTQTDSIVGNGTQEDLAPHIVNGTDKAAMLHALFGSGAQASGMISQVHIGGTGAHQNSYANIRAILTALGVKPNSNVVTHNTHFHLYLNPPTAVGITASLLATTTAKPPQPADAAEILAAAQTLLKQIQSDPQQETLMLVMDVPNIPAQEPPLMVAQATAAQNSAQKFDRVIGVCHISDNPYDPTSAVNAISPAEETVLYFRQREHRKIEGQASVSVLKMPAHGVLEGPVNGIFAYYPEKGFIGNDRATLLVEVGGKKVKMEYFFRVMKDISFIDDEEEPSAHERGYCPVKARVWKISSTPDANGNNTLIAAEFQPDTLSPAGASNPELAALSSSLDSSDLSRLVGEISGITLSIADLSGGAIGQTTGTTITLDDNAAGHGWYIDPTPTDNAEFLPTSNPNEWIAKPGSDAYGKMDMLTVLLHEYGHALGLDHNSDAHDFMATTLQPGVRRTLTVDEQLMLLQLAGVFITPDSPSEPYAPTDPG
ncbi:matrixin family metalloprotease, partial [Propionivibrio sp.]|uniref:matrixin family metalloprotease n=1 Tax=Propionivibrio sp. TaxID=2212460 RepID=UPI002609A7D2